MSLAVAVHFGSHIVALCMMDRPQHVTTIDADVTCGNRRASWRDGSTFVPAWNEPPMTLLQVLDREQAFGSKPSASWEQWKVEHPDVFETEVSH